MNPVSAARRGTRLGCSETVYRRVSSDGNPDAAFVPSLLFARRSVNPRLGQVLRMDNRLRFQSTLFLTLSAYLLIKTRPHLPVPNQVAKTRTRKIDNIVDRDLTFFSPCLVGGGAREKEFESTARAQREKGGRA